MPCPYYAIDCAVGEGGGDGVAGGELGDRGYEFAIVGGEGVTFFQQLLWVEELKFGLD